MEKLIQAPIVWIKRIQSVGQAAYYVSKYVGKEPGHFDDCKRYWRTQNYELTKYVPEPIDGDWQEQWHYYCMSQAFMVGMYEFLGFKFEHIGGVEVGRELKPPWKRFEDATL